jgi:polysaccharide deacetylase family protein (PEP-CTERM system associated)
MRKINRTITNALTVDLEDWPQSVVSPRLPITDCVLRNTDRMLALLDRFGLRATFFALGRVCEKFPQLPSTIASAGHEIASHGYGHELLYRITPDRFRWDLKRSLDIIESQIGRRPIGYRAPGFSVTQHSLWAGPIMAQLGIRYSSSIFPIAGRRYGISKAPRFPHRWDTCNLIEFPMTTVRRLGRNLPVSGGGYFRLLPGPILSAAIREVNRQGQPAVVYLHPYELAVNELTMLKRRGWHWGWRTYLTQSLFRGRMLGRLSRLFQAFRFAPMAEVLGLSTPDLVSASGCEEEDHASPARHPATHNGRSLHIEATA